LAEKQAAAAQEAESSNATQNKRAAAYAAHLRLEQHKFAAQVREVMPQIMHRLGEEEAAREAARNAIGTELFQLTNVPRGRGVEQFLPIITFMIIHAR
jgi:hypothetical protein